MVEELKIKQILLCKRWFNTDITHHDQLTFIVRYVLNNGCRTERFLKFIGMENHTGAEMDALILNTLSSLYISIDDMRGQS